MALKAGTRIGPYEVLTPLGAGGMGEVYRARDTRLGREVAVKVLPNSLHDDPAVRSRFEREARSLAALNHPHIAAIYDVIDVTDQRAIVMELVAGSTLAEQIATGPLPLGTALDHGIAISDALAAAHAVGIVHRDLKPSNIVITEAGAAKVLDFGIAKRTVVAEAVATQPTVTAALTADLAVIGTVGYMSPEQAHGRPVDARSDIFSLGVVLYEALSGRRPFQGDTTAALLSAVLRDDPPPLRSMAPTTPRPVERCVMRCLAKAPGQRYQTAVDLKVVLEDLRDELTTSDVASMPVAHPGSPAVTSRSRRILPWLVPTAVGSAIAALALIASSYRGAADRLPSYRPFVTEVTSAGNPSWSPDGRTLAYTDASDGQPRIFLRSVDATQSTALTKEPSASQPFWSPDGSRIYFLRASDGNLMSVSAGGGEPQLVTDPKASRQDGAAPRTIRASISPDGRVIVIARGPIGAVQLWALDTSSGMLRALEPAGMPRPVANVQGMAFAPDGTQLAVLASTTALNQSRGIWLISWPDGAARHLLPDAPYFASSFAIDWMPDSRRLVMSGTPTHGGPSRLLIVDTTAATIGPLTAGTDAETSPTVSRDGRRIAFVSQNSTMDLIQFPIEGGPPEPLLATSRSESYPDMSASGLLAYVTDAEGPFTVRLRYAGEQWSRAIGASGEIDGELREVRLSPDGQRVAVGAYAAEHLIWIYPTAGGQPVRLDSESTDQHGPSWSPDGNWIAYRRMVNGSWSIVKRPLGGGAAVRLDEGSPGGGATDWSSTGEWIAHDRPDGMHLVSSDGAHSRALGGTRSDTFRFSRDGTRLFAVRRGTNRRWELTTWDVATGRELRSVALPIATGTNLQWLALSPDETRIIVSAGTSTSDIWLLEDFDPPAPLWARWWR